MQNVITWNIFLKEQTSLQRRGAFWRFTIFYYTKSNQKSPLPWIITLPRVAISRIKWVGHIMRQCHIKSGAPPPQHTKEAKTWLKPQWYCYPKEGEIRSTLFPSCITMRPYKVLPREGYSESLKISTHMKHHGKTDVKSALWSCAATKQPRKALQKRCSGFWDHISKVRNSHHKMGADCIAFTVTFLANLFGVHESRRIFRVSSHFGVRQSFGSCSFTRNEICSETDFLARFTLFLGDL